MPDNHSNSTPLPADDAFVARALQFLDGLLDADGLRQLNADLAASAHRREAFVALCELRGHLFEHGLANTGTDDDESTGPALVPPPWFEVHVEPESPRRIRPYLALAAGVLLPLVLTVSLIFALRPRDTGRVIVATTSPRPVAPVGPGTGPTDGSPPVVPLVPTATLVATARAEWSEGQHDFRPGQPLPTGVLDLSAGFAQVRLKTGVSVIVEAPARFEVRPDGMAIDLALGKLTATVPPEAHGFAVRSASATVVDFGTEFGIEVAADHATRVEVFQGQVEAAATRAGAPDAAPASLRLTKDQAVHVAPDAAAVTPVPLTPATDAARAFVRDLADARMPLPLHNTGANLRDGEPDPHWQFVAGPDGRLPEPRPAIVFPAVPGRYAPGIRERAQWISSGKGPASFPAGAYTFRTTVDLTGFEPQTATVTARVLVDNYVQDVLVNGKSTRTSLRPDRTNTETPRAIHIPAAAFRPGLNQIDVVVYNEDGAGQQQSPMAVQIEWAATAAPSITR